MNDYLFRKNCCICDNELSTESLKVSSYLPVFQGVIDTDTALDDLSSELQWVECTRCGCVQLSKIPIPNLVYMAGHATGLGASWNEHHQEFSNFIIGNSTPISSYVDIGGGNGKLISLLRSKRDAEYSALDPNPIDADDLVTTYKGFVDEHFLNNHIVDAYVFSHVFEHLLNPRELLQLFFTNKNRPKYIFIAWPALDEWVRRCLAGAINFEHSYLIGKDSLCALFSNFGYSIESAEYFKNNCCWFLAFKFTNMVSTSPPHDAGLSELVHNYYVKIKNRVSELNRIAEKFIGDVFLSPASIYSQQLLSNGLDHRRVTCILDSSPQKMGHRLYGTNLYVSDPKETLPNCEKPLIIVNGGFHSREIRETYLSLNPHAKIEVF